VLELYDAIKSQEPDVEPQTEPEFADLMKRLLEKDPQKRIKMPELRV
jgi:[calcium/calmodulin-dependent protein kinase] kinase